MDESDLTRVSPSRVQATLVHLSDPIHSLAMVEIVGHASCRMKERGVTQDEVLETLSRPHEIIPSPDRQVVRRNIGRRTVSVVYELLEDRIRVITTYVQTKRLRGKRGR